MVESAFVGVGRPLNGVATAIGEEPMFEVGDKVRIGTRSLVGPYRVPPSIRGKRGWVEAVVDPLAVENEEEGLGRNAGSERHRYRIAIPFTEVWPDYAGSLQDALGIDVFETWLETS